MGGLKGGGGGVCPRMGHRDLVLININGVLIIGGYVL